MVLGFRTFYKTGKAGNNRLLRQDKNLKPEKISPWAKMDSEQGFTAGLLPAVSYHYNPSAKGKK